MRIQIQFLLCLALTILHAPLCSCPLQKLVLPLAKQLLATILDVVNRNGTLYTAADDMAEDQAIRIGLNRADGLFVIKLGKDTSGCPFTCAICMLEGPMEGFFYFNPIVMEF